MKKYYMQISFIHNPYVSYADDFSIRTSLAEEDLVAEEDLDATCEGMTTIHAGMLDGDVAVLSGYLINSGEFVSIPASVIKDRIWVVTAHEAEGKE